MHLKVTGKTVSSRLNTLYSISCFDPNADIHVCNYYTALDFVSEYVFFFRHLPRNST